MKVKENKGITLISLIITIILLLILAGISIASLTGENGILVKASVAQETTKITEYKEILIIIGNGLRSEKILESLSTKEYMDRYQEAIEKEIEKGDIFEGSKVERKNEGTIIVTTKENYIYIVTEDEVRYVGKEGETTPPDLQESDIEFKLTPSGYTNTKVEIEIMVKVEIGNNRLQYSTDGTIWSDYIQKIVVQENRTIYARLINELDEMGGSATKNITTIDKTIPNVATISFNVNAVTTGEDVIATVTQNDNLSGVDIAKCRWAFTNNNVEIGTEDISKYTGGFTKEKEDKLTLTCLQVGNYYLHVLTVDKAGNKRETISSTNVKSSISYTIISGGILNNSNYFWCGNKNSGGRQPTNKSDFKFGTHVYAALWNNSNSYSALSWQVPVMAEKATIICDMATKGGNTQVRSTWLFGAPTQPVAGAQATGPYTSFFGSQVITTGGKNETGRQTYQVSLSGIKNALHIGFFLNSANTSLQGGRLLYIYELKVVFNG